MAFDQLDEEKLKERIIHINRVAKVVKGCRPFSFAALVLGGLSLKPPPAGTGVIAGGAVRAVVESAGIHDILTKCIGSANPHNVVRATIAALRSLRSLEQVAHKRGKQTEDLVDRKSTTHL